MLVQGFESSLELGVTILETHGLDGIAPGGGLAEQIFELTHFLFKLADFAFDVCRFAVGELAFGLVRRRRGPGGRVRRRAGRAPGRRRYFGRAL